MLMDFCCRAHDTESTLADTYTDGKEKKCNFQYCDERAGTSGSCCNAHTRAVRIDSIGSRAAVSAFCKSVLNASELEQALRATRTWTTDPERAAVAARVAAVTADAAAAQVPLVMQRQRRLNDSLAAGLAEAKSAAAAAR